MESVLGLLWEHEDFHTLYYHTFASEQSGLYKTELNLVCLNEVGTDEAEVKPPGWGKKKKSNI